ncbi:MAG: alpha/beta hydrolase [Clostridia bacterium]|nr:alpha/beta hydrolase [Clostridia bacterium]
MNSSRTAVVYIHGAGGSAEESKHYISLFSGCEVLGFDYRSDTPWDSAAEFRAYFQQAKTAYDRIILVANSIGAYFAMNAGVDDVIDRAYFISPMVDMEAFITRMMSWAGVTDDRLAAEGEIETSFGPTLSWKYLTWVRTHPVQWTVPTAILYGSADSMVQREWVEDFAAKHHASLMVMEGGEHWFHTEEQMAFLDRWLIGAT